MTLQPPANLAPPSEYRPGTSEWWLERLSAALIARLPRFKTLDQYFRGTQDLSKLAGQAWRESELRTRFPDYLHANHSRLIVNATAQRLHVLGFRMTGDLNTDAEAARIWTANEMESESAKATKTALVKGECPVLVEPNPADPRTPIITPQDPAQVIVWHAAGDSRIRQAAMKTWWDDAARRRYFILYLPDRIERWRDREPGQMDRWLGHLTAAPVARWERVGNDAAPAIVRNPLGVVPIVVIPNDPQLQGRPEAEHESVLGRIDHYNATLMNMAVTSHELAYPQRWGVGVDADEEAEELEVETLDPDDPAAELFADRLTPPARAKTGQTRWITTPTPDASFGQFAAATIENYAKELDLIRADIATDTFTPYHFLLNMPSSVPPSGESITASETPLVDKCRAHIRDKGTAWREVMRLAFLLGGDLGRADALRTGGRTVWEDPERRTEGQHVDALGKMRTMLGVPFQATWELLGKSPEELARWRKMLEDGELEDLVAERLAASTPEPAAPGGSTPTPPQGDNAPQPELTTGTEGA